MSNVNIKRAVENIRLGTTIYTAIVEVVVNAIEAIESEEGEKWRDNYCRGASRSAGNRRLHPRS